MTPSTQILNARGVFGVNICMYELYVHMQIVPFMKEVLQGLDLLDVVMHFGIALPAWV